MADIEQLVKAAAKIEQAHLHRGWVSEEPCEFCTTRARAVVEAVLHWTTTSTFMEEQLGMIERVNHDRT